MFLYFVGSACSNIEFWYTLCNCENWIVTTHFYERYVIGTPPSSFGRWSMTATKSKKNKRKYAAFKLSKGIFSQSHFSLHARPFPLSNDFPLDFSFANIAHNHFTWSKFSSLFRSIGLLSHQWFFLIFFYRKCLYFIHFFFAIVSHYISLFFVWII